MTAPVDPLASAIREAEEALGFVGSDAYDAMNLAAVLRPLLPLARAAMEERDRIDAQLARRSTLDGFTRVQAIALALRVCEETDPRGEVARKYIVKAPAPGEVKPYTPNCACGAPHEPDDEDPCACPCHEVRP